MKTLVAALIILGLFVSMTAPLEEFCSDGDDCCSGSDATCTMHCVCSCTVSLAASGFIVGQPNYVPLENIPSPNSQNISPGFAILPDLPPRFLA